MSERQCSLCGRMSEPWAISGSMYFCEEDQRRIGMTFGALLGIQPMRESDGLVVEFADALNVIARAKHDPLTRWTTYLTPDKALAESAPPFYFDVVAKAKEMAA